jgi:hypothetical protein
MFIVERHMAKYRVHTYLTVRVVDEVKARSFQAAVKKAKQLLHFSEDGSLCVAAYDAEGKREFIVDRLDSKGDTLDHREFGEDLKPL